MAIPITSFLVPKNNIPIYLLEDIYLKGGFRVVATIADRDSIPVLVRKAGMLVLTALDKSLWILDDDKVTWKQSNLGGGSGTRAELVQATPNLNNNDTYDFTLEMGKACVIYNLSVDVGPCEVYGYSTPARNDSNPYKFIATATHLTDDGTTYLSDGSSVLGRRYTVLTNLENPPLKFIYWRIKNTSGAPHIFNLTLSFLPLE